MRHYRAGSMNEFARRIADQERRQDKRLELLEGTVREIGDLTLSVQRLAQSLESMVEEQGRQGRRLQALEEPRRRKVAEAHGLHSHSAHVRRDHAAAVAPDWVRSKISPKISPEGLLKAHNRVYFEELSLALLQLADQ